MISDYKNIAYKLKLCVQMMVLYIKIFFFQQPHRQWYTEVHLIRKVLVLYTIHFSL